MKAVLIFLGVILVVLGILAGLYETTEVQTYFWGLFSSEETTKPFEVVQIPFIVAGAVLLVIAAVVKRREIVP